MGARGAAAVQSSFILTALWKEQGAVLPTAGIEADPEQRGALRNGSRGARGGRDPLSGCCSHELGRARPARGQPNRQPLGGAAGLVRLRMNRDVSLNSDPAQPVLGGFHGLAAPDALVEHFDEEGEAHRKVDIPLRDFELERFANQGNPDQ